MTTDTKVIIISCTEMFCLWLLEDYIASLMGVATITKMAMYFNHPCYEVLLSRECICYERYELAFFPLQVQDLDGEHTHRESHVAEEAGDPCFCYGVPIKVG